MNSFKKRRHTGFIIESEDAGALGCIGWAIDRHLNTMSPQPKPIFHKIREDTKTRKDNLEKIVMDRFYNLLHKRPIQYTNTGEILAPYR
jgi:hypothetical protein